MGEGLRVRTREKRCRYQLRIHAAARWHKTGSRSDRTHKLGRVLRTRPSFVPLIPGCVAGPRHACAREQAEARRVPRRLVHVRTHARTHARTHQHTPPPLATHTPPTPPHHHSPLTTHIPPPLPPPPLTTHPPPTPPPLATLLVPNAAHCLLSGCACASMHELALARSPTHEHMHPCPRARLSGWPRCLARAGRPLSTHALKSGACLQDLEPRHVWHE